MSQSHHDSTSSRAALDPRGHQVTVVGGGLAGTEATWQLAVRGVPVRLIESRPTVMTPAHHTGELGELVCSNSFKGTDAATAAGLLKQELAAMGSVVLATARLTAVPAGGALAVERARFSALLTELVTTHPLVEVRRHDQATLPPGVVIVATGPLTSEAFEPVIARLAGEGRLAFYDAAAPIVDAATVDRERMFQASRYEKGSGPDYLNAPMSRDEYEAFVRELNSAKRAGVHDFDRRELFSACQPVEEIARTGIDALRFGPLKPVGLSDPRTGDRPWAVVQLRAENAAKTAYNLVGFQTNLAFGEQQRVFRMIPGLEHAEFLRYGVMHRNTFVDSPRILDSTLAVRSVPRVRMAGQVTGTEGYLEAAASGLLAALNTYAAIRALPEFVLPRETALGSLIAYATDPGTVDYQPMHVNFGLLPPLAERVRGKRERYAAYSERAWLALAAALDAREDLSFDTVREAAAGIGSAVEEPQGA